MPLKEQRPWYENALLLTVAGSIIVVVGQLAGTIIPIMYGPGDISDYSISASPAFVNRSDDKIYSESSSGGKLFLVKLRIDDIHPYLRPYRDEIYFHAPNFPKEVLYVYFYPSMAKVGNTVLMSFYLENVAKLYGNPMIRVQGIGEDGKIHNLTIYLSNYG
jgi:hypothetical protein